MSNNTVVIKEEATWYWFLYIPSYGPGEDDAASGGISSENKPRIVLMGLRRCVLCVVIIEQTL